MADDKSKVDARDRNKVAGGEDYELRHFATEAGITMDQARRLVAEHGNDRETLMAAAKRLT